MKLEEKARRRIDALLEAAGWSVQNQLQLNLGASLGVAMGNGSPATKAAAVAIERFVVNEGRRL